MQNRIRTLRTERQWSQAQLAERLGVSRQTINALEVGKYDPSLPLAFKIAQLFNTSIEEIFSSEAEIMFDRQPPLNFSNLPDAPLSDKFTPRAVKVIKLAQKESHYLGHTFVGTEQILLGLIEEETGIAAGILKSAELNFKATRLEVEKIIGRGNRFISVGMPLRFTARAKSLLDCAEKSASELGHDCIDTEHLLLGLLRVDKPDRLKGDEGVGVGIKVLQKLGIDLEALEQQVLQVAARGTDLEIAAQIETLINSTKPAISLVESGDNNSTTDFVSAEIGARFCAWLFAWIEPRQLGRVIGYRTEFHLSDGKVLTPQIAFVAAERLKRVPRIYPELAPDMFVEIKSAIDRLPRLQEKLQIAIALGVKVGLLLDPDEQTVTIYRPEGAIETLRDRDMLTVPELLPGWELPISNLWPPMF